MRPLRPLAWTAALGLVAACGSLGPVDDVSPPLVGFVAPVAGATVGKQVSIEVGAVDNDAVDKVEIFVDGTLLTTLITAPYRTVWGAAAVPEGSQHVLRADATDVSGNKGSAQVTVTVATIAN